MNKRELQILLSLKDEMTADLEKASRSLESTTKKVDDYAAAQQAMGKMALAAGAGAAAGAALAYNEADKLASAQDNLAHILRTATGASDAQVASLNGVAKALSSETLASQESVTAAMAKLATFDLESE